MEITQKYTSAVLYATFVIAIGVLVAGCSQDVADSSQKSIYFSPFKDAEVQLQTLDVVIDQALVSDDELEKYAPVIEGFVTNADSILRRADSETVLEQVEKMFILSGRYFELTAIYQRDVQEHQANSAAAFRLAWIYMQLGQQRLARDLIDLLVEAHPEEALSWILDGAYWIEQAETSSDAALRTIKSWQKALDINPRFEPFKGLDAAGLRMRIDFLKRRYPDMNLDDPAGSPEAQSVATLQQESQEITEQQDVATPEEGDDVEKLEEPSRPAEPKVQETAAILVAKGQLAQSMGRLEEAQRLFEQALRLEPEHVDAGIAILRVSAQLEMSTSFLRERAALLAQFETISARQAYELGHFVLNTLGDNALAVQLFERAAKDDPQMASRLQLEALIERIKQ